MAKKPAAAISPIDRARWVPVRDHWQGELARAADLPCETPEHEQWWGDVATAAQAELRDLEEDRTLITKPINAELRDINAEFKAYSKPLEAIKALCKAKVASYMLAQRAAQQRALAALAEADTAEALVALEEAEAPSTSKAMRKSWAWQVASTDVTKMPAAYLQPNLSALGALCAAHKESDSPPKVEGVVFERVPVTGMNGKR